MIVIQFSRNQAFSLLVLGVVGTIGLVAFALSKGINGAAFTSGLAAVGLLVGWAIGRRKSEQ